MSQYLFDIESNNKDIFKVDTIHSIVIMDVDTQEIFSYRPYEIQEGLSKLEEADLLIGHNIIGYDCRVIRRLFPHIQLTNNQFDTMIAARLTYPDVENFKGYIPHDLRFKHSLEAWGYRLGEYKGDYGKQENAWDKWTPEMQKYCEQDVKVNYELYKHLIKQDIPYKALDIEQRFQYCINFQEEKGILVDIEKAQEILDIITPKKAVLLSQLQEIFPPIVKEEIFVPKSNNKTRGYVKGVPFTKRHIIPFNPNSSDQVIERLTALGWVPEDFTKESRRKYPDNPELWRPSTEEKHIQKFKHPSIAPLVEYKQVCNVITKIAGGAKGEKAWLENIAEDGRLHHKVYPFGTNTRRCSHSPNVTQLQDNEYLEYVKPREIVIADEGKVIVGGDASALEARCLANAVNDYEFMRSILESDIHSVNQKLAGLKTRSEAKTFYYCFIYGGGDAKVGSIIGGGVAEGRAIKDTFFEALPSLKILIEELKNMVKQKGYIISIDGAKVPVPKTKSYISLNYYLQGMGAIVMKVAYINMFNKLVSRDWLLDKADIIMFNHDELQVECDRDIAEEIGQMIVDSIIEAGVELEFNLPLDGEYKSGLNWSLTH